MSKILKRLLLTICSFMFLLTGFLFVGSLKIAQAETPFAMIPGASIRVIEPYGIMFQASVPAEDAQDANKTYHMMIIPEDYVAKYSLDMEGDCDYYDVLVQALGASNVADMKCKPFEDEGQWYVRGSLVGVLYSNLNREFIGIAYYEEDGVRTYAEFGEEYTRSISNVASRFISSNDWAYADEDTQEFVEDLVVKAYDKALGNAEGTTEELPAVAFNYDTIQLLNNENSVQLSSNYAWDVHVDWQSTNTNVATVDENGVLQPVGVGETTVKATVLGEEKTIAVTVQDIPEAFENVYIDPTFSEQNKAYYKSYAGHTSIGFNNSGDRPAYVHNVNSSYNTTINEFSISTEVLAKALAEGLTTLSVDVKLVAGEGLKDEVKLMWASTAPVVHNSATTTVTTGEWKTMTIDLTTVAHWADASQKAFVVDGDTVTVNCASFGITSKEQGTTYKVLFSNFRMEATGGSLSGMYVNDNATKTFNLYSDNKAQVVANGETLETYGNCKIYSNGAVKFFNGTDFASEFASNDYAVVNNGKITIDGETYATPTVKSGDEKIFIDPVLSDNSAKYKVNAGNASLSYVFESTYDRPAYLHNLINSYNTTINEFAIDLEMLTTALKNGFTTLSVDVKLVAGEGLKNEVKLMWASTAPVVHNSATTTVTTGEWKTMTIDLTKVSHWADASQKAFVVDGDTVTVNCKSFGITSKEQNTKYKVLFSNFRVGENAQTEALSGIYMNTTNTTGNTFGRDKLAFYTTGEAVITNGTTATTYACKSYQDGTIKLCGDTDNYLAVLLGETIKLTNGTILYNGDTYTAANFTAHKDSSISYDAYVSGAQPSITVKMNQFSETTAKLILNNEILDAALAAGYTKLNISAIATRDVNIVLSGTGLWAQQKKGRTEINSETYTLFTIDLTTVQNNASPKVYCVADPEGDGSYVRQWAEVGVSQGYDSLGESTSISFCDYYFSK